MGKLLDDSGPEGKAEIVLISFFYNDPPEESERATVDTLLQSSPDRALSFFALQGKQKDGGYVIESSKEWFLVRALGARAGSLAAQTEKLQENAEANEAHVLDIAPVRLGRNWKEE